MKLAITLSLLLSTFSGDHARGVQLMKEGKFAEAAEAFRAAALLAPTDAEVHYNLALALWRAGDAAEAEIAAEKAATLSDGKLGALRDGILGNLAIDAAKAKLAGEQPDLQAALGSAQKARDHFVRGATAPRAPAELVRNVERALKLIAEIEKQIEQQKQQDQKDQQDKPSDDKDQKDGDQKDPQQKDDKPQDQQEPKDQKPQDGKDKDKDKQDGDKKDQDQPEQQDKSQQQGKDDKGEAKDQPTPPQGEPDAKDKPEPKPEPQQKPDQQPEPKPDDKQPPQPGEAPKSEQPDDKQPEPQVGAGEAAKDEQDKPDDKQQPLGQPLPGRALSPEETKRLMDMLAQIKAQQAELDKAQKAARPKVKKDW